MLCSFSELANYLNEGSEWKIKEHYKQVQLLFVERGLLKTPKTKGGRINNPAASYLAMLDFATRSGVLHCQSKRLGVWTKNLRSKLRGIEPQEIKTTEKYFNGLSWVEIFLIPIVLGSICFLPLVAFTEFAVSLVQWLPNGAHETSGSVFGRIGSLTTIGAIVIELWILRLVDIYQRGSKLKSTGNYISKKELRLLSVYKAVALLVLAEGTFIWGFGDLLA